MTNVLIVDDSFFVRRVLTDMISDFEGFEVVDSVKNGRLALDVLTDENTDVDVMTLDVEMPEMGGLETLREMRKQDLDVPVLMVSALTDDQAEVTTESLSLGAADVIAKPSGSEVSDLEAVRDEVRKKLRAVTGSRNVVTQDAEEDPSSQSSGSPGSNLQDKLENVATEVILIGGSTGAPGVLTKIVEALPANLPVPVVIVQHIDEPFLSNLCDRLDSLTDLSVRQVSRRETLRKGTIYFPGNGDHLVLTSDEGTLRLKTRGGGPEYGAKPSVNVLFESALGTASPNVIAVLLSGMGRDGSKAMNELYEDGALCLLQDEDSSAVFGMPGEVAKTGSYDLMTSEDRIPSVLLDWVQKTASLTA